MNLSLQRTPILSKPYLPPSKPKNGQPVQFGICPICLTSGAIAGTSLLGGGLLLGLITRLKKSFQSIKIPASPIPMSEPLKVESDSLKNSSEVSGTKPISAEKDICCS